MNKYGSLIVSAVILAIYAIHAMGYGGHWTEGDQKLMDTCLTLTVGYWLGSSAGSARKSEIAGRD